MNLKNKSNGYVDEIGSLFDKTPKSVFAAIAISSLTSGGDYLEKAREFVIEEWRILHQNGIVPQKPPKAKAEARP